MGCFQPKLVSEEPKTSFVGTGPTNLWKTNNKVTDVSSPERRLIQGRGQRCVAAEDVNGRIHKYYAMDEDEEAGMSPLADAAPAFIQDDVPGAVSPSLVKVAGEKAAELSRNLGRDLGIQGAVNARDVFSRDGAVLAARAALPFVVSPQNAVLGEMLLSQGFPPYGEDFNRWAGRPLRSGQERPESYVRKSLAGNGMKGGEVMVHPSMANATMPPVGSLPYVHPGDWITPLDRSGPLRSELAGKSWHLPLHVASARFAGLGYPSAVYSGEIPKPGKLKGVSEKFHKLKKSVADRVRLQYLAPANANEVDVYDVLPEPEWGYDTMWHRMDPMLGKGYAASEDVEDELRELGAELGQVAPGAEGVDKVVGTSGGSKLLQLARDVYADILSRKMKGVVGANRATIIQNMLTQVDDIGYCIANSTGSTSFRSTHLAGMPLLIHTLPGNSKVVSGDQATNLSIGIVPRSSPGTEMSWASSADSFASLLAGSTDSSSVIRNLRVADPAYSGAGIMQLVQRMWFDVDSSTGTCSSGVLIPLMLNLFKYLMFQGESYGEPFANSPILTTDLTQQTQNTFWGRLAPQNVWNGAVFAIPSRICTLDQYFGLLGGSLVADNNWAPSSWGVTTAVIPIRREQSILSPTALIAWSSAFLPHPLYDLVYPINQAGATQQGASVYIGDRVNLPLVGTATGARVLYVLCDQWSGGNVNSNLTFPTGLTLNVAANSPIGGADLDLANAFRATIPQWWNSNALAISDYTSAIGVWGRWLGTKDEENIAISVVANSAWAYTQRAMCASDGAQNISEYIALNTAGLNNYLGNLTNATGQNLNCYTPGSATMSMPWYSATPLVARMTGAITPATVNKPELCLPGVRAGDVLSNCYWRSLSMAAVSDLALQATGFRFTDVYFNVSANSSYKSSMLAALQQVQTIILSQSNPGVLTTCCPGATGNSTGDYCATSFPLSRQTATVSRVPLAWLGKWTGKFDCFATANVFSYSGTSVGEYRTMYSIVNIGVAGPRWVDRWASVGQEGSGSLDDWYKFTSLMDRRIGIWVTGKNSYPANGAPVASFACLSNNYSGNWVAELGTTLGVTGLCFSSMPGLVNIPHAPALVSPNFEQLQVCVAGMRNLRLGPTMVTGSFITDSTGPSAGMVNVDPSAFVDVQKGIASLFR